jgi:nucleoside 2-deoxyribosyltransferase
MLTKKIYLAGNLGFSELGRYSLEMFKTHLRSKFNILDPFEVNSRLGDKISLIEKENFRSFEEITNLLIEINMQIGEKNKDLIIEADILVANLDGTDVDSGTAAEIGFAFAKGKTIIGYRGDFRYSGDNLGSKVNLQVEYFIRASGGKICNSIEKLLEILDDFL